MKSHWNWAVAGLVSVGLMGCQESGIGPDGNVANHGDEAFENDAYENEMDHDDEMMDGRQTITANRIVDQEGVADERVAQSVEGAKREFVATIREGLEKVDSEIAQIETQSEELSEDARAEFDETLAALKEKREELQRKLDDADSAGADAWIDLRSGISETWTELKASVNDANQELTEKTDEAV